MGNILVKEPPISANNWILKFSLRRGVTYYREKGNLKWYKVVDSGKNIKMSYEVDFQSKQMRLINYGPTPIDCGVDPDQDSAVEKIREIVTTINM